MTRQRAHHSMAPGSTMEWRPEHDDAIRDWVDQGLSRRGIAIELNAKFGTNTTRCAVIGRCNRRGIKSKLKTGDNMRTLQKSSKVIKPKVISGPIRIGQPPRMVREEAEIRCAALAPRHLTLLELEPGDCRYPYGEDRGAYLFCGHTKQDGSSYCGAHFQLTLRQHGPDMLPQTLAGMRRGRGMTRSVIGKIRAAEDAAL